LFSGQVQKQLEGLHESRDQEAERPRGSRESPDEAVHRRLAGRGMDVHRGEAGACGAEFQGLWDLQQAWWERSLLIRIRKHSGMRVLETFGVELLGIVYLKSYPTIYGNNRMASRQIINLF